jgi:hypothetical protein
MTRLWLCEPPPGSGLPEVRLDAENKTVASLRLHRRLREIRPDWHPSTSYRLWEWKDGRWVCERSDGSVLYRDA